jgi:DNA-directed RNA polymerase
MATVDEQVELEHRMVQSGIERFNKTREGLLSKQLGSKTKHGRTIIKGIIQPVAEGIDELHKDVKRNRTILKTLTLGMDPEKVAYLALVSLIDTLATQSTLLKVARSIGIQVETQKRLDEWLKLDKGVAKNMIKEAEKKSAKGFDHKRAGLSHKISADGFDIPTWSNESRIHVGLKLINIIIEVTGIVKLDRRIARRKTVWHVVPTKETEEWIEAFNLTNEVALPRYSPCIIEPKDWNDFWGGGYYSTHINKLPFVRIHA